jgi:hypothetical protein
VEREAIGKKIDELVNEVIEALKKELGHCIESIMLFGSYTFGRISLERPNVNMLIFLKENASGRDYLKIGEIFYSTSKKYKDSFSVKIDSLPFRFGFPTEKGKLQLVLAPNIINMVERTQHPPFGIPCNVLGGMKKTRKVVFGSDPLADIEVRYEKKDVVRWAMFDVGILFRNMLLRAPLTYDVEEHLDMLVDESVELGKIALVWGAEIFLDEEEWKKGRHIELIKDKDKLIEFYRNIDKEMEEAAKIILGARKSFKDYVTDKEKAFKLYEAAYTAVQKVFLKVLSEMKQ